MANITADQYTVPSGTAFAYLGRGAAPAPAPAPALAVYRNNQPLLFGDVAAATDLQVTVESSGTLPRTPPRVSVADPKVGYIWGVYGPSHAYVSHREQWRWANPGGDWVNMATPPLPQATTQPHFSFAANTVTSGSAQYTVDMAAALNAAFTGNRWAAFIVKVSASSRSVAGLHHATLAAPSIAVTYTDGSTATLDCTCCTGLTASSSYAQTGYPDAVLPLALEFRRPTKAVATAIMTINVMGHTATPATISGYLANPSTAAGAYSPGVAAAYPLDEGLLAGVAGMQMVQRFQDGSVLADYVLPSNGTDYFAAADWDPSMTGGAVDLTKLPTAARGASLANKWLQKQATSNVTLVSSSYTGEGFQPHAPGLGALRIVIPGTTLADGEAMGPNGSLGSDLVSLFPKGVAGTEAARTVNVRFKLRLGSSPKALADTKMIRPTGGAAQYATLRGKGGIGPMHWTHGGGNNQTGGGGLGWTGRLGIEQVPADMENGGLVLFTHSLDMDPEERDMSWGGTNGLAGTIYPNKWVEIEIKTTLNTWNPAGGSPFDGVQEIYIDGRLATTLTNWQWRDGPIAAAVPGRQPAMGTLGALGAVMNFYQGGVLAADGDVVFFVSAVAVSTGGVYIGPMRNSAANPWASWPALTLPSKPAAGTITQLGTFTVNSVAADADMQFMIGKIFDSWPTGAKVELRNSAGQLVDVRLYLSGGGHASTGLDATFVWSLRDHLSGGNPFSLVHGASPAVAATTPVKYSWINAEDPTHAENILANGDRVPASHHPYAGLFGSDDAEPGGAQLVLTRSTAVMVGDSPVPVGQGHHLSVATGKWARSGALHPATSSTVHMTIRDRVRKRLVRMPANGATDVYTADYTSGDWANLVWVLGSTAARTGYGWSDNNEPNGVHHEPTDLYLTWAGNGQIRAFDPANLAAATTVLTTTGLALPTMPGGKKGVGLQVRTANGEVWILDMTTAPPTGFYVLTPPASSPLTSAWTVTRRAFTGASCLTGGAGAAGNLGTFEIPQYLAALDGFLVWGANNQPVEIWSC